MSGAWAAFRRGASFRGVPFVVLESNLRRGRQVALHVYPFRDEAWPEDLGRSPRLTSVRGFVVGDDADDQIADLIEAAEAPGPGLLVHPTLGSFTAQVLNFSASDAAERGRVWSFEMTVAPAVARIYPAASADTQGQVRALFGRVGQAVAGDLAAVRAAVAPVVASVAETVRTVQSYAASAQSLVQDATSFAHIPASVLGNFGRFNRGRGLAIPGVATFAQVSGTVNGAVGGVQRTGAALAALAARL